MNVKIISGQCSWYELSEVVFKVFKQILTTQFCFDSWMVAVLSVILMVAVSRLWSQNSTAVFLS